MRFLFAACLASTFAFAPAYSFAQDEDEDLGSSVSQDQEEQDPIVLSMRQTDPKSLEDLAEATQIMLDIDRDDEAKVYLGKLNAVQATDIELFQLARKFSTAFLHDLNSRAGLKPENREFSQKMIAAIRRVNSNPARLDNLVKQLSDPNEIKKAEALADLQTIGAPAAAAILTALADDARSSEYQALVRSLRRIGPLAEPPLRAGLLSPSRRVRIISADQLIQFRSRASLEVLLATMIANTKDGLLNQTSRLSVQEMIGRGPSDKEAAATVLRSAQEHLRQKESLAGDFENKVTIWDWEDNQLVGKRVAKHVASRVYAQRRADALYRFQPDSQRYARLSSLCALEAAKLRGGIDKPVDIQGLQQKELADPAFVEQILVDAMDAERIPAAIAAAEILASVGDASLVESKNGRLRPLVRAVTFGDRRLQFAATESIMKLNPTKSFPGSSYVSRSLVHLVASDGQARSIVGHVDRVLCQSMVATLGQVGLQGQVTTSSRELFDQVVTDSDVEFILISDTLNKPDYAELVQQLRHDWRTRRTPIAVLTRTSHRKRGEMVAARDPLTVQLPWSTNASILARQISRLLMLNQLTRVDANERAFHAEKAAVWLEKISSDKKLAEIYQLASQEKQLNDSLFLPSVGPRVSKVISRLATRDGQKALLLVVNDSGQPAENRKACAAAFAASINRSGTLLTTTEIKRQYERYNASEYEDKESQQILASVLDSIETRAGRPKKK